MDIQQQKKYFKQFSEDITVDDLKKIVKRYKLEKEFKLGKEMPSQEVMMQLYMRIQGIENAKGFQLDEAMLDSVIGKLQSRLHLERA